MKRKKKTHRQKLEKELDDLTRSYCRLRDKCCQRCGRIEGKMDRAHIVPRSKGGTHKYDNLVISCCECNRLKRDLLLNDFYAKIEGRIYSLSCELRYYKRIIKNREATP